MSTNPENMLERLAALPAGAYSLSFGAFLDNLSRTERSLKRAIGMCVDAAIAVLAFTIACLLRLDDAPGFVVANPALDLFVPISVVVLFTGFGVYRWVVRSSNVRLCAQIVKSSIASSFLLAMTIFLLAPADAGLGSVVIIYGLLLLLGSIGARLAWRGLIGHGARGEPVAIYGAGSAGRQLVGALALDAGYRPVLFIDDDPEMSRQLVSGLPVVPGRAADLGAQLARRDIRTVILAMPSLPAAAYARKLELLDPVVGRVLTMPTSDEIRRGHGRTDEVREISERDILGREEVAPDPALLERSVTGKVVMVTGGGGSIGSELCRQIMSLKPTALIVVDNAEASLYHIAEELEQLLQDAPEGLDATEVHTVLCSVTDRARIARLMRRHRVETVYHAAAYKHVPIVERFPEQGVEVNVFGTKAVLDAALDYGVERFVLVSTDKAVRPKNAMGATKRVAELVLQARASERPRTIVCMVRFGNVLGSSGSVVPKFRKQIESGLPVTITHPDIERYFMTIPEAAQLVLQAGSIARGGEVFVLDMGEPVRIIDLARSMVHLYGKRLQLDTGRRDDVRVVVSGLRPGEKMREELFLSDSSVERTELAKVSRADEHWLSSDVLAEQLKRLQSLAENSDSVRLREELLRMAFLDGFHVETRPVRDGAGPERRRVRRSATTAVAPAPMPVPIAAAGLLRPGTERARPLQACPVMALHRVAEQRTGS